MKKEIINNITKLIISISLLIVSSSIAYYYVIYLPEINSSSQINGTTNESFDEIEFIFNKRAECSSYRSEIEQILQKIEDDWFSYDYPEAMVELDAVFYSPVKNTCLYSYSFSAYADKGFIKTLQINDYFTNELIFRSGYMYPFPKGKSVEVIFEEEDKLENEKQKLKR